MVNRSVQFCHVCSHAIQYLYSTVGSGAFGILVEAHHARKVHQKMTFLTLNEVQTTNKLAVSIDVVLDENIILDVARSWGTLKWGVYISR
jgi:hypothetical protein